jgi:hypothetical protein
MKMNRLGRKLLIAVASVAMLATSCISSTIFDQQGDCSVHFKIKFRYDMNMEYADAFHSHVRSVTLYAFGEDGKLAYQKTESGDALGVEGWMMDVSLEPGTYDLLAWCGLEEGDYFKVPAATIGKTTIEELKCRLERNADNEVKDDLNDLFHGSLHHGQRMFHRLRCNLVLLLIVEKQRQRRNDQRCPQKHQYNTKFSPHVFFFP